MALLSIGLLRALPFAALLAFTAADAMAQDLQRIAAVVNDKIISVRDLDNRTDLVVKVSKLPNTQQTHSRLHPQILRLLIEEQLQLQEAERLSIVVSDRDLDIGKGLMETRFRVPKGSFDQFFDAKGIDAESALAQIRASIAWTKLVQRRFANISEVSEEEIDEVVDQFERNMGKPQFLAAEILLPVDDPADENQVRQLAQRLLEEIQKGGNFNAIAQQFSASASAVRGGQIGWISPGQLASELEGPLTALKSGEVSAPIRTLLGYHILKLEKRRILSVADPLKAKVTLKHVFLPLAANAGKAELAGQMGIAEAIAASVQNCDDMDALAKEVKSPAGADLGRFSVGELAPVMRDVVATLQPGVPSKPVRLPTGVSVMMVCERVEPPSDIPQREDIRPRLRAQKLDILARRYLRDLRREAFIESRI
ncbi:MAG: peptidylprolyl isomerase [Proteobacteria bacterium]|nr:peptidylprolyl isomerase [Pseudomonadota bacterium]MDA1309028.1 peptidylprolyl isomerase [Pseudomonadota bacterium]